MGLMAPEDAQAIDGSSARCHHGLFNLPALRWLRPMPQQLRIMGEPCPLLLPAPVASRWRCASIYTTEKSANPTNEPPPHSTLDFREAPVPPAVGKGWPVLTVCEGRGPPVIRGLHSFR